MTTKKQADYAITRVRYNSNKTHIEQLEVRTYLGTTHIHTSIWRRADVIKAIENDVAFVTAIWEGNQWKLGADVHIIPVDDEKYLRTDNNKSPQDNLGNLQTF